MNVRDHARVLLLSGAPGVGGGERATIPTLARDKALDITVAGYEPVRAYAEQRGLKGVTLALPFVSRISQVFPLMVGAVRVSALARRVEADVLYANGSRAMPYAVLSRLLGSPALIVHHHGLFTTGPIRMLVRGIERTATAIIVPSRAVASEFRTMSKVHVVPNGIDLDHFQPPRDQSACKRSLGIPSSEIVVGTIGRAAPGKGMETFLRVAGKIVEARRDVRLLVVGGATFPHEEVHYEALKREAVRFGDRVILTGPLGDPLPALQSMDVFVHLGAPEGFGLTVVEAMACRIPVVSYRWGGVADIVEHEGSGLLVGPEGEDEALKAIIRLVDDPALREDLGHRGRELCKSSFDVRSMAAELSEIVRSVA